MYTSEKLRRFFMLPVLLASGLALTACGRDDGQTVGQKVDNTVAVASQKAEEARQAAAQAGEKVEREAAQATQAAQEATANAAQKAESAVREIGSATVDAAITTRINAALAADGELKALAIDVDTENGKVVLNGTAPSNAARERAAELAKSIDGVKVVENRLRVNAG